MTVLLTNQNLKQKKVLKNVLIVTSIILLIAGISALIFFIKNICDRVKFKRIYDRINYHSSCLLLFNISKHNAGCLRSEKVSFYNASKYCYNNDMLLLEIDSEQELEIVIKETKRFFENSENSSRIWINGRWSSYDNNWLIYPKNKKLGFKFIDSIKLNNDGEINCLSIKSSNLILEIILISTFSSFIYAQKPTLNTNQSEFNLFETNKILEKVHEAKLCLALFNLSDKRIGCLSSFPMTFNASLKQCSEYNMTLLDVRSDNDRNILFDQSKKFFSINQGTVLWINGKYSFDDNSWLLQPNNEKLLWTNKVQSPLQRFIGRDEYCMTVQSPIGSDKYEIATIRCKHSCYFFCQFNQE